MLAAVGIFIFQFTLMSTVLGFTSALSFLRPALLAVVILCPIVQLPFLEDIHYAPMRGAVGAACVYTVVLYLDTVMIHKFTFEAKGPTSAAGGLKPIVLSHSKEGHKPSVSLEELLSRLWFGLVTGTQGRFPGTKWPVKSIPPHSRNDPSYIPSRAQFVLRKTPEVFASFTLLALVGYAPQSGDNAVIFSPEKVALFSRVGSISRDELITRTMSVLGYWTVQYFIHVAVHGLLGILFVGCGISKSNAWPPIFGSVRDAYSIRSFWGYATYPLLPFGEIKLILYIYQDFLPPANTPRMQQYRVHDDVYHFTLQ